MLYESKVGEMPDYLGNGAWVSPEMEAQMFRRKIGEQAWTSLFMYAHNFTRKMIEVIWERPLDIVQGGIIFHEDVEPGPSGSPYLELTVTAQVVHRGVLVTMVAKMCLFQREGCNHYGWVPAKYLGLEIRSVPALKGVDVRFDIDKARGYIPYGEREEERPVMAVVDFGSRQNLARIRAELGLGLD